MLRALLSHLEHAILLVAHEFRDYPNDLGRVRGWPAVRADFLSGAECAACGSRDHLEAHHIIPYHLAPQLELERSNLIALCMSRERHCHLRIGHGGDYAAFNPHVVRDAEDVRMLRALGDPDVVRSHVNRVEEAVREGRIFDLEREPQD